MGYSKESALPEQKVYCHTYDSLVGVLADRMVIREKVLLPQEGDSFDHEDIYSWISAVDLEDKGPKIEASLSAERGKNPITIDVEKQETIKSDDEKVSNETLLYSMALTEAKMKVISDIAEETYPAIAFQIKDYRREMEKIREEILGSVEKGSSLDEILSRMSTRRGFLISSLVIAGMVLAACNHLSTPEPTATATPFQPQVTETSPAYETPGVTETPFVEVTATVTETASVESPTPIVEIMSEEEIKKNVELFFDGKITFEGEREKYLYTRKSGEKLPIGFFFEDRITSIPQVEFNSDAMISVLLGIYRDVDKQYMVLGSKDLNGRSFVWVGTTGYLDVVKYPHLGLSYSKITSGEVPSVNFADAVGKLIDQNKLKEVYIEKINLPIYFSIDANTVIKDPSFKCGQLNVQECDFYYGTSLISSDLLVERIKGETVKSDFIFDEASEFQANSFDSVPLIQNFATNTP